MKANILAISISGAAAVSFCSATSAQSINASEGSILVIASVGVGASLLVAAPLILSVNAVETVSSDLNSMRICATDREGRTHYVDLPRRTVQTLGIQPGDRLTTTPREGGAMLEKQGRPVAFLMAPTNANLVHSHELAQ